MTPDIAICLTILGVAILLFAWDRVPADVIALGVMLAVVATGLLPPDKAFAGFSSDTVMMILGLLIMSAGLIQTGVVEITGRYVFDLAGRNPAIFLPVIMVSVATVSAFMSNTAATAFFVPLVIGYAAKIGASPSRFLLPLAFASILTSSVTLISTSTNLVVSEILTRYQQAPMGMFEMAPVGIPIAVVGLLYVWSIGVRLIPQREDQKAEEKIGERKYQADVVVVEDGPLVGKSLSDAKITADAGFTVVKLIRGKETVRGEKKLTDVDLQAGDELIIEGLRAHLLKIKDIEGLDFKADVHLVDPDKEEKEDKTIVEGVLLPRSPLIGQSLRSLDFKERYGLQVLALHRAGRVPSTISSARLRMGDVLLLQGTNADVKALEQGNLFNIFGGVEAARLNRSRAPLAAAIFVAAIAAVDLQARLSARCGPGGCIRDAAHALPLSRGGLPPGGVESPDPDRCAALARRGHGDQRCRQVSRTAVDRRHRRRRALSPADVLLHPDGGADPAHVQPGRGPGGAADRHANRNRAGRRSAALRHDGRRGGKLFLPDAAGAFLPHGLRTGQVSVFRFPEGRHATDGPDLHSCDCARPLGLAAAGSMNATQGNRCRLTRALAGQAPRYAVLTSGLCSSSMPGPVIVTRPWSST